MVINCNTKYCVVYSSVYDAVGVSGIDDNGVLATATSTGGVVLKHPGRVGDAPMPSMGFYELSTIASSSSGLGDYIMRTMHCLKLSLEYELSNLMHQGPLNTLNNQLA